MKLKLLAALACLTSTLVAAADIPPPYIEPIAVGDSWTYKKTVTIGNNSTKSAINYKISGKGENNKLIYQSLLAELKVRGGPEWRKIGEIEAGACLIDVTGGGSLGLENTCAIEFVQGMDWDTEVVDKGQKSKRKYAVIGKETISVPAGTFDTTKIEAVWQGTNVSNAKVSAAENLAAERTRFTYWYSPETRAMVKVVRKFHNGFGAVESTVTEELDSFRSVRK
ncbi:MAG TPA: hypothetical protein VGC21_04040 [Telluria sp.]|jgi:hypothetical protein